ncbi:MAG: phycobilisome linker polypeptide [Nostoc sp. DedQUE04]|uniref:phycobilisome linker polypeptide n=1 Tax=Nostoc sp. DedQUE04 TaxID=3075390 RepID=UPI002AD3CBF9|nr:phycobilisome linker polypeptide [Nostoc sp. DedQUE04]MDZ8134154.1 phycobilisome linker polypeptide [Nostoc sp. DedQUE04]
MTNDDLKLGINFMIGAISSTSTSNRYFRYEVVGLRQVEENEKTNYPIRSSASVFFTVPENRMNQEMQRISRLGGKIVNIQPLNAVPQTNNDQSAPSS